MDVSRDWLDIHCLSDDRRLRLPNTDEGHSKLEEIAAGREALVCFEATGGHEWRLWANMAAAGIEARQLAPAQVKAFGRSRGTSAKTVEDLTGELLELLERQISEVEERIAGLLANDAVLAETAALAGLAPVAPAGFASSRARRLNPQHGPEAVRRSAAEGGEAAQGGRHRRRPQARGDRQRLVQIPPALDAANRMTDRGPSAEAGWGCGNVGNPGPERETRMQRK